MDVLGSRSSTFQVPPSWSCLERAVLTTLSASGTKTDCSYIISCLREQNFNAIILVTILIPVLTVSSIDVTKSTASIKKSEASNNYSNIVDVFGALNSIEGCPALCFVETDCKKFGATSDTIGGELPAGWERISISSFGFTTWFCIRAPVQCKLISDFTKLYFTKDWSERYVALDAHKKLVNVLIRMSISSSITPVPLTVSDVMLAFTRAQIM